MILGICGSLREKSINRLMLRALQTKLPDLVLFNSLAELPFFNPDIEFDAHPIVEDFRRHLKQSSAIVIGSPEYAHGVTGVMKNALDWVVGTGEFMQKPTIVVNCSGSATIANLAIIETLSVMEAKVIPFPFPLKGHGTTLELIQQTPELMSRLNELARLAKAPG